MQVFKFDLPELDEYEIEQKFQSAIATIQVEIRYTMIGIETEINKDNPCSQYLQEKQGYVTQLVNRLANLKK